jgi:cardiolipin synthase A/B
MWKAIAAARSRVRLETYIWKAGLVADRFLLELHAALGRGVRVELLLDAFGSDGLPADYFQALRAAGARVVWFNPRRVLRLSFRNHRKLLTVDAEVAVIGGLNIADEYDGDGVERGWRDFAVELRGGIVPVLDRSLDRMFRLADFGAQSLQYFARHYRAGRRRRVERTVAGSAALLLSGPGTRSHFMQASLRRDLQVCADVLIYAAYLLPPSRMRRAIRAVAHRGRVRLMTGALSDVPLVRWAAQRLYPFWLRGGVQLFEYQPQIVHAKLIAIDDIVYVGSANLDIRSLRINYELLVRVQSPALAAQVRAAFEQDLQRARPIDAAGWRATRRWWHGLVSLWAYLLLVRLDPYLARQRLKRLA